MVKHKVLFSLLLATILFPVVSASTWIPTTQEILDNHDDNSLNTSIWQVLDTPVGESSGELYMGSAVNSDAMKVNADQDSRYNFKQYGRNVTIYFDVTTISGSAAAQTNYLRLATANAAAEALVQSAQPSMSPYTHMEIDVQGEQARACTASSCDGWNSMSSLSAYYLQWEMILDSSVGGTDGITIDDHNFTIDGVINLEAPINNINTIDNPLVFSSNATAPNFDNLVNATLYVWNSTSLVVTNTTTLTGRTNSTSFSTSGLSVGMYDWNVYWCSDSECSFASSNYSLDYGYVNNSVTFDSTTYQTSTNTIVYNVSVLSGSTLSAATLYWNNTAYTPTITNGGNYYLLTNTFQVPTSLSGSTNFFYNLTIDDVILTTLEESQTVGITQLALCNASLTTPYLNITFKNETVSMESVSALLLTGTFEYYLGDGTITKSLSYTNSSENPSYAFCAIPSSETFYIDPNVVYDNSESGSRAWNPTVQTITNNSLLQTLYLLPSSQSTSVSFVIKNTAEQSISGATVNVSRTGYGLIAIGTTDDSGTVNFELDQSATYTISASKTGYPTGTLTVTPAETIYTIVLGESVTAPTDYRTGIYYSILPNNLYLSNNTAYAFNITLTSSYWDVTEYGFIIQNLSGTVLDSASTTTEGVTTGVTVNTGNNTVLQLKYYWVINNTYTNGTVTYAVLQTGDTQYSISNFASRFTTYLSSGLFGLENQDNFGTNILIFMIIFLIMAGISYSFGLTSPEGVGAMLVILVALFDVGLGLITFGVGAINHFATIITFIAYFCLVAFRRFF